MATKELNLSSTDQTWVTQERIREAAEQGIQVNLFSARTVYAGQVMDELQGTGFFHGETVGNVKQAEILRQAISEKGLHREYTCWDVLPLRSYKARNGTVVRYCLYLPETGNTEEKWPVMIYFHGVSDTMGKLRGPGQLLRTGQIRPNGIVIMPQAVHGTKDADFHTRMYQDAVIELVQGLADEYNGDLNRLSVAGHSDGGTTVYQIVNSHPGVFAACAPIAGVSTTGKGIRQTWLWVFQGAKDVWVKPSAGLRTVLKCEVEGCRAKR